MHAFANRLAIGRAGSAGICATMLLAGWMALAVAAPKTEGEYAPPPAPDLAAGFEQSQEVREAGSRIGRVSLLAGEAHWFAASAAAGEWIRAQPNLPIAGSSSLSTARGARAEVRIGTTTVSLDGNSQADFLQVSDDGLVIRVARGQVAVATPAFSQDEPIELIGDGTSLLITSAGRYVLGLDEGAGRSLAKVHDGQADLRLGEARLPLFAGQQASIDTTGALSQDRRQVESGSFDQWVAERDDHWKMLTAGEHVDPEMTGADELAAHGQWQHDPSHGTVWYPNGVDADWTPQRDGHWTTVAPLGPVWVASAPWGFATAYYGRWHRIHDRWGWVPGAHARRPVFFPPRPARAHLAPQAGSGRPGDSGRQSPSRPNRPLPAGGQGLEQGPEPSTWRSPPPHRVMPPGQAPQAPLLPQRQPHPEQWLGPTPQQHWPHPPRHVPAPPHFDPGPGGFPSPPRAYPTPPRQYPSPQRPWPPNNRGATGR
jgi:hypothetical protein